jgi:hypothetical protein
MVKESKLWRQKCDASSVVHPTVHSVLVCAFAHAGTHDDILDIHGCVCRAC